MATAVAVAAAGRAVLRRVVAIEVAVVDELDRVVPRRTYAHEYTMVKVDLRRALITWVITS
jgi:hypothetical protein